MEVLGQNSEVLQQFAAGELEAFESLFRDFQGEVYGWVIRIVRDPATAEDLTIETFWRIYRAHARFDPGRSFGTWARKIATNLALDYLKTTRLREQQFAEDLTADSVPDHRARNPAVQQELRQRTQRAFQQLPAKLRVVASLALVEQLPYSEIAEGLNLSTAAVKSRLFRAVQLLRRKLGNLEQNL